MDRQECHALVFLKIKFNHFEMNLLHFLHLILDILKESLEVSGWVGDVVLVNGLDLVFDDLLIAVERRIHLDGESLERSVVGKELDDNIVGEPLEKTTEERHCYKKMEEIEKKYEEKKFTKIPTEKKNRKKKFYGSKNGFFRFVF